MSHAARGLHGRLAEAMVRPAEVSLQSDRGVNRGVTNCDDAYPLGLREAIAAPLSCGPLSSTGGCSAAR